MDLKVIKIVGVAVVCTLIIINYTVFKRGVGILEKSDDWKRKEDREQTRKGSQEYLKNSLLKNKAEKKTYHIVPHMQPIQSKTNPVTIPNPDVLEKMSRDELEELYFSYMENIQTLCVRQRHIGNEKDGGYHICEDVMQQNTPCLMYSFGIRKDFSFDDGIANFYGCQVHSFDPFDGQFDHIHSSKVTFHSIGIGGKDDPKGKILTLKTIRANLNHTKDKIDILKIDVEGAEWDSLTEMVNGNVLEGVKILIVEFHICIQNCLDGNHRKKEQYVHYLSVLKRIYDVGFRIYFFRMWPYCHFQEKGVTHTTCHEVHLMKL